MFLTPIAGRRSLLTARGRQALRIGIGTGSAFCLRHLLAARQDSWQQVSRMAGTGHVRSDLLMWCGSGESCFGAEINSSAAVSTAADAVFGPAGAVPIRSDASAAQLASPEALLHRLNALKALNDLKLSGA